jgi:hypothetical protein
MEVRMGIYVPNTDDIHGWVSSKFELLAEILQDYDPYLELRWIPPDKRTRDDKKPYVVVDTHSNTPVKYASELDIPEQILADIITADGKHGDVLSKLEAGEAAYKLFQMKKFMNDMEEAADEAKFFMKSPLNTIRFKDKKFDDQRRIIGPAVDRKHL